VEGLDLEAEDDFIGGRVLEEEWVGVEDGVVMSSFVFSVSRQCKNLQFVEFLQPLGVWKYMQTGTETGIVPIHGVEHEFVTATEDDKDD
jgi:hypothetical protein